mmetsp:Transcript_112190/g.312249  ORF Transcript_112190/g.312249 Transcript_112190/m.312249 type:complete len:95 (-) Transcript_112190:480-764(-)
MGDRPSKNVNGFVTPVGIKSPLTLESLLTRMWFHLEQLSSSRTALEMSETMKYECQELKKGNGRPLDARCQARVVSVNPFQSSVYVSATLNGKG